MYINPRTQKKWPLSESIWRAPDDGQYLNLELGNGMEIEEIDSPNRSLWRYKKALSLMPEHFFSLGEGLTPLIETRWKHFPVFFKLEYFSPSGSFKDRGICVLINHLKDLGVQQVVEDSSGNAGSSIATYCALMGLCCTVVAPKSALQSKLFQIRALGARLEIVDGDRDMVTAKAMELSKNSFYASHSWHPFFLEGTKTIAYEIWEQFDGCIPDAIVAPLGQGGNILGVYIGFKELAHSGRISKMPRLYGVQAENCAPVHWAFHGLSGQQPTRTIADGIATSQPVRLNELIEAHSESRGQTVAVSELEIRSCLKQLHHGGYFVEPTSAVAIAGFERLIANGEISPQEKTVIVLTGTGLKAIDAI